jgi:hypothetical protein
VGCLRLKLGDKTDKNLLTTPVTTNNFPASAISLSRQPSENSQPMKKILLSTFIAATFAVGTANAQVLATDVASNYTTETWVNGSNLGSGFGAWDLFTSGTAGYFIGDSVAQGFGNVNSGSSAFGMFGNPAGDNYANAQRALSTPLSTGQAFSIDLAIAFRNGNKGISLFAGGFDDPSQIWNFNVGGEIYSAGGTDLGWAYSQNSVFSLTATQLSLTSVGISLVRGSDTYTSTVTSASGLSGFRAYVGSTDAGNDLNNLFVNNMQAVPEPSTYALLTLGALALGGYAARRCARK